MRRRIQKRDPKTKEILFRHTHRNLLRRYKIFITYEVYLQLSNIIKKKKGGEFVLKQSNTRVIWIIEYDNITIPVVYDKLRKGIVTVLPKNFLKDRVVYGKYGENK